MDGTEKQTQLNNDASGLIESIKHESSRRIDEIKKKAEEEKNKIREQFSKEIDDYKKEMETKIDEDIKQEIDKIKNRATIESKKLRLTVIEEVIQNLVNEAMVELKDSDEERYKSFIIKSIEDVVPNLEGSSVVVRIAQNDSDLKKEIEKAIKIKGNYKGSFDFEIDNEITTGGIIIDDIDSNLSYICTFERIIFRKYDEVRKNAFAIISDKKM